MSFILYFDGACSGNGSTHQIAGGGWIILDDKKNHVKDGYMHFGNMTNNEAEYEALIQGIQDIPRNCVQLHIKGDSKLVIEQCKGNWECRKSQLKQKKNKVLHLLKDKMVIYEHILRADNKLADALAKKGKQDH
jgi:ribonuclease HI